MIKLRDFNQWWNPYKEYCFSVLKPLLLHQTFQIFNIWLTFSKTGHFQISRARCVNNIKYLDPKYQENIKYKHVKIGHQIKTSNQIKWPKKLKTKIWENKKGERANYLWVGGS